MADEQGTVSGPDSRKKGNLRVWDFLNSQFGLWLLGSVVVGLISFGWSQYLACQNEKTERSQFMANMLPYLTDNKLETRLRAMQVIRDRYSPKKTDEIYEVLCNSLIDFGDFRYEVNQKKRDEAAAFYDGCTTSTSTPTSNSGGQVTPTPSPGTDQTPAQRPRVYIQIYSEDQRIGATAIQQKLRQESYSAPGIENLSNTNKQLAQNPVKKTQVRYFNDSDKVPACQVYGILKEQADVHSVELSRSKLNAAPGTVEIWFALTDLLGSDLSAAHTGTQGTSSRPETTGSPTGVCDQATAGADQHQ